MKIAIINLTGGGMSGGYRKYLRNVIPRMAANLAVEVLLCASPQSLNVKEWFEPLSNVEFVNCKPFSLMSHNPDQELKQYLEKFSPDVIFLPIERFFRYNKVPVVNMVRNMEPLALPNRSNPISERVRNWSRIWEARRAVKKADRVIAVSEFVRNFLIKYYRITNDKIEIVYHGIDVVRDKDGKRPYVIPEDWKGQFFFTAGSIRPARGLEDLLQALKFLSLQGEKSLRLVIAGESGQRMERYQKKLQDWVQKNNFSNRICWAGSLNEDEMTWCYQNCQAFVMTSRVESFGMIGGEAMAHGCICISADNPCLPELFGDAAVYYLPQNGKALAEVIQSVLAWDSQQRKKMSERAKKRAAEFSWDVCAGKTVAVLQKAAESRQSGKL